MNILDRIVERKRHEVAERKLATPLEALRPCPSPARDFAGALRNPGVSVIAEFKRRSPSKGMLRESADVREIAASYADHGAAALSVLTDHEFFGGDDADLQAARVAAALPALRKDFTIDEYQIHEARHIGADAILLIVRILSDDQIHAFLRIARDLGLAALVETHNESEVKRAVDCGAEIIGVNSRDLDTFDVSLERTLDLKKRIPAGTIAVAESGIHAREDVERVAAVGYDAILVGEALMRSPDPGTKLAEILEYRP